MCFAITNAINLIEDISQRLVLSYTLFYLLQLAPYLVSWLAME